MRRDSRLSRMLHVLIHMDRIDGAATSDQIAQMLGTNPVVVRRTMAGLRDDGYLHSEKGHGGGWVLTRPLSEITMLDIHRAIGNPAFFAVGVAVDHPECLVEQAVNSALGSAFEAAEKLLIEKFASVTLADLADEFDQRMAKIADKPTCELSR
ncbi:Rrf2 family transcriptional regulator [Thalassospira sp. UBA1131]|uniref:Rrf2 family transcriptional regulator n=1 Tax=Thalassospira sp. UBA1131 TaxID=1947672 RepID=UPI0025E2FE22|nr:Rrf2 family transcriptional regulator [Thalassospira sp. UBA1131]